MGDVLKYKPEIDGLRSIAVIAVVIFHANFLEAGYLGVDVFFVISGFLITSIINNDLKNLNFSFFGFYERRIRRIIPLVFFIMFVSIFLGYFFMLPDDFENLNQSVIATLLFSNNILLYMTSGYWGAANEYKPLMHTWSLGVEEQFYFLYPIILYLFNKYKITEYLKYLLLILISLSFASNYLVNDALYNFFQVSSRFYELSIGSIISLIEIEKLKKSRYSSLISNLSLLLIILIFFLPKNEISVTYNLFVVLLSSLLIVFYNKSLFTRILESKVLVFLGKLSFGIYLWHQLLFAFFRLIKYDAIVGWDYFLLTLLTILLSYLTYISIEKVFRNKSLINRNQLYGSLGICSLILFSTAFFFYSKAGVVRNYPELNISYNQKYDKNFNTNYNESVYRFDKQFVNYRKKQINVLVIGNSFARDFTNMLNESEYSRILNISYCNGIENKEFEVFNRIKAAQLIFIGSPVKDDQILRFKIIYDAIKNRFPNKQIMIIGTKNFGTNNNPIFNNFRQNQLCEIKVVVVPEFIRYNLLYKKIFKDDFIDVLGLIIDKENKVPVFTPSCKLISQDCDHLTKDGAKFLGSLLKNDSIFNSKITSLIKSYK
jgi:peptidoglycan/LPS O-acetylase OafA/YrhL